MSFTGFFTQKEFQQHCWIWIRIFTHVLFDISVNSINIDHLHQIEDTVIEVKAIP